MPLLNVSSENFGVEVLQSTQPVMVLWGASQDVNSNQIAYQMMTKLDHDKVKMVRIDIDESPDLVMKYSIRDVPLVVLFIQGMAMMQDTVLSDALIAASR